MNIVRVDWFGCYGDSWQSAPLVPAAYAHPAKVPFGLAERIYRHMLAEGWLRPGDRVLDLFGGIGGCAFHAMLYGMRWTGVELEPKFVDLAQQNIELWNARYGPHMPGWGTARIIQGDSRRLAEIVGEADGCVSSPPYAESLQGDKSSDREAGMRRYEETNHDDHWGATVAGGRSAEGYGTTPGQLGAMPAGDFDGAVASPPYSETRIDGNGDEGASGLRNEDGSYLRGSDGWAKRKEMGPRYGSADGNLGNMPAGDWDGAVSSPPYAETINSGMNGIDWDKAGRPDRTKPSSTRIAPMSTGELNYGTTMGQLGSESVDTFWTAAREIVAQTYALLRPGAVAAWITGDFVRNKKRVPFGEQWLALCESVGFEPLLWAVAWKQDDHGAQLDIFGNAEQRVKTRVSFFRRLSNAKSPESAILNEDVLFLRKP